MKKVEAIIRPERAVAVKDALAEAGFNGLNMIQVSGRGVQRGIVHTGRGGQAIPVDMLPKVKIELVVADESVEKVVDIIIEWSRTGAVGDGKIFIQPVLDAVRVRTGERGDKVL